ncbi:MAG: carboxy-S-adenosyl-L-methionine synthase CmoA [Pseudomonadota bacterium]
MIFLDVVTRHGNSTAPAGGVVKKDTLFRDPSTARKPFTFDSAVVDVFADMIGRSVPIYQQTLTMARWLAANAVTDGTAIYDLGCSEGAALAAACDGLTAPNVKLVGIDNSAAMLASCERRLRDVTHTVELINADIATVEFAPASLIMLNFTLQFVAPDARDALLARAAAALVPGGALLLSEKIRADSKRVDAVLINRHEDFKRENAYSELEIARKRESLENVLIPDTTSELLTRLSRAGLPDHGVWLQTFNFLSIVALK